jgi:hypothetical protein
MSFWDWLVTQAIGPATFGLPVGITGEFLAGRAKDAIAANVFGSDEWTVMLNRTVEQTSVEFQPGETRRLRQLLEDAQVWTALDSNSGSDIDALITKVSAALSETRDDQLRREAAEEIVKALIAYALDDPKMPVPAYRAVVLSRTARLSTEISAIRSTVDSIMLIQLRDVRAALDRTELALQEVVSALDLLQPASLSATALVEVYLRSLIVAVDVDPLWQALTGHAESPSSVERALWLQGDQYSRQSVDDVIGRSQRIEIQADGGSGKSWLMRRAARQSAQSALVALCSGQPIESIELPMFGTCSAFFSAAIAKAEQSALVHVALAAAGIGDGRAHDGLRDLLQQDLHRLVLLDSLDEASKREVTRISRFPPTWRVVVTTRRSAGGSVFPASDNPDNAPVVGHLAPLRYPEDVEDIVRTRLREKAEALLHRIRGSRRLQSESTLPILLTFYCAIAWADDDLPETRSKLYGDVVRRLLAGEWREESIHDVEPCVDALKDLAWTGATMDNRITSLADWPDSIQGWSPPPGLTDHQRAALDHIAPPPSRKAARGGERRFLHRTLWEHFVAEAIIQLDVAVSAAMILPQLWYRPSWESVVPDAIARHPDRESLLRKLLSAALGDPPSTERVACEPFGQVRLLLCRLAGHTSPDEWSEDLSLLIADARRGVSADYSMLPPDLTAEVLSTPFPWPVSRSLRGHITYQLCTTDNPWHAWALLKVFSQLIPTGSDMELVRTHLINLVTIVKDSEAALILVEAINYLEPSKNDTDVVRNHVINVLTTTKDPEEAHTLVKAFLLLAPTGSDRDTARNHVIDVLTTTKDPEEAHSLVETINQLAPTKTTRNYVLNLLTTTKNADDTQALVEALNYLAPTKTDTDTARNHVIHLLTTTNDPGEAHTFAWALKQLAPSTSETDRARNHVMNLLTTTKDVEQARPFLWAFDLLFPVETSHNPALSYFIDLLTSASSGREAKTLLKVLNQLAPTTRETETARNDLIDLLTITRDSEEALVLVQAINHLAPSKTETGIARNLVVNLLTTTTNPYEAPKLVKAFLLLAPAGTDRDTARNHLIHLLTTTNEPEAAHAFARALNQLAPTGSHTDTACNHLLNLIITTTSPRIACRLVEALNHLAPTKTLTDTAHNHLIHLLTTIKNAYEALLLVAALKQLDTTNTNTNTNTACNHLIDLLSTSTDGREAEIFVEALNQLAPSPAHALSVIRSAEARVSHPAAHEVGAAARHTVKDDEWVEFIRDTVAGCMRQCREQERLFADEW